MNKPLPSWIDSRMYFLKTQGKMLLSGESRIDLTVFSRPELAKPLSIMKYLDISKTPLESIDGLSPHKKLKYFIANQSHISSLRNFKVLRSVDVISLIDTPVSKHPNYKLSLLLVIGEHLNLIDGKLIPRSIREKVKMYSPIAADLINAGWMAEYPCPPIEVLNQLCAHYGIQFVPKPTNPIDLQIPTKIDKNFYTGDFEETLQKLKSNHEEILKQGQALFGLIDENDDDDD